MLNGRHDERELGACTVCGRATAELRAGTIDATEYSTTADAISRSAGSCMVIGAASTIASMAEALGMVLPGNAAIPAPDSRRLHFAKLSGRQAVRLARVGLRPPQVMTEAALENAIRVLMAISGSTNAVLHLVAIVGRLGLRLPLNRFDELSRSTPWLVSLKPSGEFQMEKLFGAGGLPSVMHELAPLLRHEAMTVTGATVEENVAGFRTARRCDVVATFAEPRSPEGGLAVLRGNFAQTVRSSNTWRHRRDCGSTVVRRLSSVGSTTCVTELTIQTCR
jgi:dihydroxy-acid dehydratase